MNVNFWLFLKGAMMGAADIVPGVSGGTIAFITGIYERLIQAIRMFLPALFQFLRDRNWQRFCAQADVAFLLVLFAGMLVSILLLARLISWLLLHHPIPIWSAFFGLILASVVLIQRHIKSKRCALLFPVFLGAVLAWWLTSLSPASMAPTLLNAFVSGGLAICAMILPGISGSFILVMLGSYAFILQSVVALDLPVLAVFAAGCLIGLLSVAQVLGWAFEKYHDVTLAFLTGVMVGALNKVWPWREVLTERLNRHGESVPVLEKNVLPSYYERLTGDDPQVFLALGAALAAALIVLFVERWSSSRE